MRRGQILCCFYQLFEQDGAARRIELFRRVFLFSTLRHIEARVEVAQSAAPGVLNSRFSIRDHPAAKPGSVTTTSMSRAVWFSVN